MIFHVITIFPDFVRAVFDYGVLRRGIEAGLIGADVRDLRDYTHDKHRTTDDAPFGGGPGMVMLAEPVFQAVEVLRAQLPEQPLPLIFLSPAGERLTHKTACALANGPDFILLCGRYEGIDQRVVDHLVEREISIGDYVLSGGELPAMVLIDAVARQIPGVVGNEASCGSESFATGLLDWPHYTRPEVFRGVSAPPVLLSGNHAKIESYRQEQALVLTYLRRPELLDENQRQRAEQIIKTRRQEEIDASTEWKSAD
jgi:tRNA (guanine37-N1)-methyltransferase